MTTSSPAFAPPRLSPLIHHVPGATPASQAACQRLLLENHRRFDIFERNGIFHNHLAHHLLTAFTLGASPSLLQRIFDAEQTSLVPLDPVARKAELAETKRQIRTDVPLLDANNWTEFAGVGDAYDRYLAFFEQELAQRGIPATLDRYLFSEEANAGGPGNKTGPRMLIRLTAGVVHPFIQLGFGAEFNSPMMLAEGLAEAAVHSAETSAGLYPGSWPFSKGLLRGLGGSGSSSFQTAGAPITALEVYRRFVDDREIVRKPYDADKMINTRIKDSIGSGNTERMQDLAAAWMVSSPAAEKGKTEETEVWLANKVDEVQVLNAFLACATGRLGKETRIDFFLMHLLTSSLFLPSILPLLPSFAHQRTLLESYMLTILVTSLSRGRPTIDARIPLSWPDHPAEMANADGNDWCEIIQRTLGHPDSHVIKSVRALLHLGRKHALAGSLPGAVGGAGAETFDGMADVDGAVFVRMAAEIGRYQGWSEPPPETEGWDRSALGWDEAWR